MRKFFLSLLILLLLSPPSFATGRGELSGEVAELLDGKETPGANLPVRVSIFKNEVEIAGAEVKTNSRGRYSFRDLETGPEFAYEVWVEKKGVPFRTNGVGFAGAKAKTAPKLMIVPTTGDSSSIMLEEIVLFEFQKANSVKVLHSLTFSNIGAMTYDGRTEGGAPITVDLLKGGFELQNHMGLSSENTEIDSANNRLKFKLQIPPGPDKTVTLRFGYSYQMTDRTVPIALSTNVERTRFSLTLVDKDLSIATTQLTKQPPRPLKTQTYYIWSGGPFKAGQAVEFTMKGISLPQDLFHVLLFSGFGLVLAVLVFVGLRRPLELSASDQRKKNLEYYYSALANLERGFRTGNVSAAEYREQQERIREILYDLLHETPSSQAA